MRRRFQTLNEAIRLKPNYAEAILSLVGYPTNNLGRREEAISDLNEAIRLKPNHAEAYFFRGLVQREALGKR